MVLSRITIRSVFTSALPHKRKSLAALLALLLLPFSSMPISAQTPPPDKDWIIDTDLTISDETFLLNHSLIVNSGVRLELFNVTLNFNVSSWDKGLYVQSNASLKMENCSMNIQPSLTVKSRFYVEHGVVEIYNSTITNLSRIQLNASCGNISGCTIFTCQGPGIYSQYSQMTINSSRFSNGNYGVSASASNITIRNCDFMRRTDGSSRDSGVSIGGGNSVVENSFFEDGFYVCAFGNSLVMNCGFGTSLGLRERTANPPPIPRYASSEDCRIVGSTIKYAQNGCSLNYINENQGAGPGPFYEISVYSNTTILNCTFDTTYPAIIAAEYIPVIIENNTFLSTGAGCGISADGYSTETLMIRNNTFLSGFAINMEDGGATVTNNVFDIERELSDCWVLSCVGSADINNNSFVHRGPPQGTGIIVASSSSGGFTNIFDNKFSGFETALNDSYKYGDDYNVYVELWNNTITNCSTGIHMDNWGYLIENNISADCGIESDTVNPNQSYSEICGNTIRSKYCGMKIANLDIVSNNNIVSDGDGIRAEAPATGRISGQITQNNISAREVGISVKAADVYAPSQSSVDSNVILGSRCGIAIKDSNLPVKNNDIRGIIETGIHAIDYTGNISENSFSFGENASLNSSMIERRWSLRYNIMYNTNPKGPQANWVATPSCNLLAKDGSAAIAFNGTYSYHQVDLCEYSIRRDGSRTDYNPYSLLFSGPDKGAATASLSVPPAKDIQIFLQTGPDLTPLKLEISPSNPIEGDLIFITATVGHDNIYNPAFLPAENVVVDLKVDNKTIGTTRPSTVASNSVFTISKAWVAEAGWHNTSAIIDPNSLIFEVFKDNNVIFNLAGQELPGL